MGKERKRVAQIGGRRSKNRREEIGRAEEKGEKKES